MLMQVTVETQSGTSVVGIVYPLISLAFFVVLVIAIIKFFQLANDVRSILQLLLAESEARHTD